jgi:hypothetical protein
LLFAPCTGTPPDYAGGRRSPDTPPAGAISLLLRVSNIYRVRWTPSNYDNRRDLHGRQDHRQRHSRIAVRGVHGESAEPGVHHQASCCGLWLAADLGGALTLFARASRPGRFRGRPPPPLRRGSTLQSSRPGRPCRPGFLSARGEGRTSGARRIALMSASVPIDSERHVLPVDQFRRTRPGGGPLAKMAVRRGRFPAALPAWVAHPRAGAPA